MADKYSGVRVCGREKELEEAAAEEETLKRRISGHPLYGLLLENHLNCLKVGLGEMGENGSTPLLDKIANTKLKAAATSNLLPTSAQSDDLDEFMVAYCDALNKLKEAMADPLKETSSFIESTYAQLDQLIMSPSNKPH